MVTSYFSEGITVMTTAETATVSQTLYIITVSAMGSVTGLLVVCAVLLMTFLLCRYVACTQETMFTACIVSTMLHTRRYVDLKGLPQEYMYRIYPCHVGHKTCYILQGRLVLSRTKEVPRVKHAAVPSLDENIGLPKGT